MAAVINDRDVLLLGSDERTTSSEDSNIILQPSATGFSVNSSGVASPATITISAALINLTGTVTFTATGVTVVDNHDNTATIAYSTYTGQSATVTATLSGKSQSITVGAVATGGQGSQGPAGMQYKDVSLYQWATALPNKPTGNSNWSWVNNVNAAYSASDGWSTIDNLPNNPGGNFKLYVATVTISAPGGTASTIVSYAMAVLQSLVANGANGISGTQAAEVVVYRWDTSIPTGPVGTVTLTWADRSFVAPNGWERMPSSPPSQGLTRYAARIQIIDSATATTTTRNWTGAAIYVDGSSGNNGAAGPQGASATIAYAASTSFGDTFAPTPTTGKNSVPATNDGGIVGVYSLTVPTVPVGQRMYQTDGIYDPLTDKVVWSAPYWSVFKVGSLAAITAIMGRLTITDTISDANGNWSIDGNGLMTARQWKLLDPNTGQVQIQAGGSIGPEYLNVGVVAGNKIINSGPIRNSLGLFTLGLNQLSVPALAYTDGPAGNGCVYVAATGTPPTDNVCDINGPTITSIIAGKRYEFSAYFASYRCSTQIFVTWYKADGSLSSLPYANGPWIPENAGGGVALNGWGRAIFFGIAPPDAASVRVSMRMVATGRASPTLFTSMWYAAAALASQSVASEWSDGVPASIKQLDYTGDLNASFGAPNGTNVGTTPATTVESNAAAGAQASAALPGITNSIATKLNKAGNDAITGSIALHSAQALLVGDSNNGIYYGSTGLVGRKAGQTTFAILADGSATFAGQLLAASGSFAGALIAASGTLGSLMLANGGYIASGAFTSWAWPSGTGVGFYIGPEGMRFGNPSTGKYFQIGADGNVYGPGFKIENGQPTFENPVIINPDLRIPAITVSVSQPTGSYSSHSRNGEFATQTAFFTVSGGSGDYVIEYSAAGDSPCRPTILTGSQSAIFVTGPGYATNGDALGYQLYASVTDNKTGKRGGAVAYFSMDFS